MNRENAENHLIEPNVIPPFDGDDVAKPHMGKFMTDSDSDTVDGLS